MIEIKPLLLLTALIVSPFGQTVAGEVEGPFYQETADSLELENNLVAEFGIVPGDGKDISGLFQKAIDGVSKQGGGKLFIPAGTYLFSGIELKSNVHLKLENGVVINVPLPSRAKSFTVFSAGSDGHLVENVSVRGVNGRFRVNLPEFDPGIRVFQLNNVRNFLISDFDVYDQKTKFSAITFGISSINKKTDWQWPRHGEVRNASVFNAGYGYGMVQMQAGDSIFLENLHGLGGVTLRLETGYALMNDLQVGGIRNILGENISCKDGNAAGMISPHSMHNGVVVINGVKSIGCGWGVRIGRGFISNKQKNPSLTVGTFAEGTAVRNVHSSFGHKAQLKAKHYKYIPLELRETLAEKAPGISSKSPGATTFVGPSVAAVGNLTDFPVIVENVTAEGFKYQKPVIFESDAKK